MWNTACRHGKGHRISHVPSTDFKESRINNLYILPFDELTVYELVRLPVLCVELPGNIPDMSAGARLDHKQAPGAIMYKLFFLDS